MKDVIVTEQNRAERMDLELTTVYDNQMSRLDNQLINGCECKISFIQHIQIKEIKELSK
jgi:hypothetical protein